MIAPGSSAASRRPHSSPTFTTACSACANSRRFAWKYSSIEPWKSRCSCARFVNTRTANRTPSSRPSADAWDVASITQAVFPASTISRKRRWRSIDSGVFSAAGRASSPTRRSMFVRRPGPRPAALRIAWMRYAVVVFPAVPVTAATSSSRLGSPKNATAARAIARRVSATTSCGSGRSSSRSTTSAAAPCAAASGASRCPSACRPRTQKNSAPGTTALVSYARSAISAGAPLTTRTGSSAGAKRSSCTPLG